MNSGKTITFAYKITELKVNFLILNIILPLWLLCQLMNFKKINNKQVYQ
jgi:hypothetical protein